MTGYPIKPRRSGGPKTAEGKLTASKNALKTGAYSRQVILPFEIEQEFEELKNLFIADFRPEGVTEYSLVHELTVLAWKKLRLEKIENNYIQGILQAAETASEFYEAGFTRREKIDWLLNDLSILTPEFIERNRQELILAKSIGKSEALKKFLITAENAYPDFYERLKNAIGNPPGGKGKTVHVIRVSFAGNKNIPDQAITAAAVESILKLVIEESEAILYVADHMDKLVQLKSLIRDRRLKHFMETSGVGRPYQELSRSFFKVLAELRKQQEWRYQKDLVDVTAKTLDASQTLKNPSKRAKS